MAVARDGRAAIVWEDSTADGGRTLSLIHTLSTAMKACEPDIAVARDGSFVVARHEEQFPFVKNRGPDSRRPLSEDGGRRRRLG